MRVGELRSVYLLTTDARDYFGRHGFTDCPREEAPPAIQQSWEWTTGCPSTAAFMRRSVDQASAGSVSSAAGSSAGAGGAGAFSASQASNSASDSTVRKPFIR